MFNRQPFNRGKFNVSNVEGLGASGISLMVMGTKPTWATRTINASGKSEMKLSNLSNSTNVKYSKGLANLSLGSFANATKVFNAVLDDSDMFMGTNAEQTLSGEEVISLDGLVLKPGDELIINTCDMTVTVNAQNAMQYFSDDSDFISLLSGENSIEYNDASVKRKIAFDVIWKDRWL